jgi:hypothetical protein
MHVFSPRAAACRPLFSRLTNALPKALFLSGLLAGAHAVAQDILANGASLPKGGTLTSSSGEYQTVFRDDGKLAIYKITATGAASSSSSSTPPGTTRTLTWESSKGGFEGPGTLVMQEDNNLVIYNATRDSMWHTGTFGDEPQFKAYAIMENSGNLCLYSGTRRIWSSGAIMKTLTLKVGAGAPIQLRGHLATESARDALKEVAKLAHEEKCVVQ